MDTEQDDFCNVNADHDDNTIESPIKNPSKNETNKVLESFNTLYLNIHLAQRELAKRNVNVFTMQEAEAIMKSKTKLTVFFESNNNEFTTKNIEEASLIILGACEKLNTTGVFDMEGCSLLLDNYRIIEKEIEKRKSPSEKLSELRQKKALQNDENNKGGNNRSNRGRGKHLK